MLDISTTTIEKDRVVKRYSVWNTGVRAYFERAVEFASLFEVFGLGPTVLDVGDAWLTTRRGLPLTEALDPDPLKNQWAGRALAEAIEQLHEEGFAHRDVQSGNLLVTPDSRILFIDCELACRVDPTKTTPYDFVGPLSGVSPPETHAHQQIAAYWDSETVDNPPWKWCGRLETYLL